MPQLDPTWFASQLFWLVISFFSMLFIMSKFIAPRIADILAKRQHKIDEYLDRAAETKQQAEESLAKYNAALSQATREANEALEQTKKALEAEVSKKQEALAKKLHQRVMDGEAKIAAGKEDALAKVRGVSEELAAVVIKKIGVDGISNDNVKAAIKTLAKN